MPRPSDPQSFNRYTYVRNNPVNLVDPSGHIFGVIFAIASFVMEHMVTGAIIGALVGGTVSAAMGGDFAQGAISGAISGAIFGGIGGLGLEGTAQTLAHAAGGAASGGINAAMVGGDPVKGALLGGLSAGTAQQFSGFSLFDQSTSEFAKLGGQFISRSVIGGTIAGVSSEISGGAFVKGFETGFYTAAVAFASNHVLHDNIIPAAKKAWKAWSDFIAPDFNDSTSVGKHFWEGTYNNPPAAGFSITVAGMKTSVTTEGTFLGASSTGAGISFDIYSKKPSLGTSVGVGGAHFGADLATDMTYAIHLGVSEDFFRGAWVNASYNYMYENNGNAQWAK